MYRAAVITASDRCFAGGFEDLSGKALCGILKDNGYNVADYVVLPDDKEKLKQKMIEICDLNAADLIVTTGGTGFSPKDVTPEATLEAAERIAPGIAEAIRAESLKKTNRAMLSRGVSAIRKSTLIINVPGSVKGAVESIEAVLDALPHGLDVLRQEVTDCGR